MDNNRFTEILFAAYAERYGKDKLLNVLRETNDAGQAQSIISDEFLKDGENPIQVVNDYSTEYNDFDYGNFREDIYRFAPQIYNDVYRAGEPTNKAKAINAVPDLTKRSSSIQSNELPKMPINKSFIPAGTKVDTSSAEPKLVKNLTPSIQIPTSNKISTDLKIPKTNPYSDEQLAELNKAWKENTNPNLDYTKTDFRSPLFGKNKFDYTTRTLEQDARDRDLFTERPFNIFDAARTSGYTPKNKTTQGMFTPVNTPKEGDYSPVSKSEYEKTEKEKAAKEAAELARKKREQTLKEIQLVREGNNATNIPITNEIMENSNLNDLVNNQRYIRNIVDNYNRR